jgi:dipeptide/tripeptide permease
MARGDQFQLLILGLFFVHSLIAFVIFVGVGKLLNYRALKNRPVSWSVAGSVGVIVWVIRDIFVHAMDPMVNRGQLNVDALSAVVIPALALLAIVWFVRLLTFPVK